jgi:hypothetical protein
MTSFFPAVSEIARVCRYLLIISVTVAIFATFRVGLVRNFDDTIGNQSWGRMLFGIGAAITQIDFGGYGHTIAAPVEGALITGGLTDDALILSKLGTKFPDNLRNASLMNAAIDKAARLDLKLNPEKDVRGAGDDDVGFADYVRLSFYLFGHKLLSLYLFYFVVFITSSIIFIYTFRQRSDILTILLVGCVAQLYVFGSILLDPDAIGSITDPRYLSVLGIVPALHVACVLLYRLPPSPGNLAGIITQSIIFLFVTSIRDSIIWAALGIFVVGVLVAIREFRAKRSFVGSMWSPAVLLIIGVLQTLLLSSSLHPVYREGGELGHHGLWHALFYQLQYHPDWNQKYASRYDNASGDTLPQVAAQKYLLQHPVPEGEDVYLDAAHKQIKAQARELYVRKAFIDFFTNDPKFVIENILIYSPKTALRVLAGFLYSLTRHLSLLGVMIATSLLAGVAMLTAGENGSRMFLRAPLLLTGAFVLSLLPNVLAVQHLLVMSDPCLLVLAALISWVVFAVTEALRWAITWWNESALVDSVLSVFNRDREGLLQWCRLVMSKIFFELGAIKRHVADVDSGHGFG